MKVTNCSYRYWGNDFLHSVVNQLIKVSPSDILVFTLVGASGRSKISLHLSFIIADKPNPENIDIYFTQDDGITLYLNIGQYDRRQYMVLFKALVHALCNGTVVPYPDLVKLAKAVTEPTQIDVERFLSSIRKFFEMFGANNDAPDPYFSFWGYLYATSSEKWDWFIDEQFDPFSKNKLPEEPVQVTEEKYVGFKRMKLYAMEVAASATKQLVDQTQPAGENPHAVLKEQIGIREYGCCTLGIFKNAKVYFVNSLKGLRQLEADLKRTDLVKSERRDMEQWFHYPELRGKTIRLNNFDFVIALNSAETKEKKYGVVSHEALHVVLSLCKQIGYNPLNEQEPATYALEYLVDKAMDFYN